MGEQALGSARVREGFCIESLSQRARSRAPLIEKLVSPTFQAYRIEPACGSRDTQGTITGPRVTEAKNNEFLPPHTFGFQRFSDALVKMAIRSSSHCSNKLLGVRLRQVLRKSC